MLPIMRRIALVWLIAGMLPFPLVPSLSVPSDWLYPSREPGRPGALRSTYKSRRLDRALLLRFAFLPPIDNEPEEDVLVWLAPARTSRMVRSEFRTSILLVQFRGAECRVSLKSAPLLRC